MNKYAAEAKIFYIYWSTFYKFVSIGEWKPKREQGLVIL